MKRVVLQVNIKLEDHTGFSRFKPIELERLNMFPDNHTQEAADTKRAFLMGNALVVGVIEKLGESLYKEYGRQYQTTYHTLD